MAKLKPIHPGEILREEFLKPLNISQRALAERIGVTPTRLNQLILEKRSVTADTALRLGRAFGTTAKFWLNLQSQYDLDLAKEMSEERINREIQPIVVTEPTERL